MSRSTLFRRQHEAETTPSAHKLPFYQIAQIQRRPTFAYQKALSPNQGIQKHHIEVRKDRHVRESKRRSIHRGDTKDPVKVVHRELLFSRYRVAQTSRPSSVL